MLLFVMTIFALPVYKNGITVVSYIAKYICDNSVFTPRSQLTLYTDL